MFEDINNYQIVIPINLGNLNFEVRLNDVIRREWNECVCPPHNHGAYQLKYFARGKSSQVINKTEVSTSAGNLIIVPPRVIHYTTEKKVSEDLVQYSLFLYVKPPLDTAPTEAKVASENVISFLNTAGIIKNASPLAPLLENMDREVESKKDGCFHYLQGMSTSLLVEILRFSHDKKTLPEEQVKYTDTWRRKLNAFFYDGYMNDIKLQDLADTICVSRRHASRIVFKEYGVTYAKKLMEVRLEQAKYQLTYTEKDLRTISAECGFQSCSYFTTAFKKNVGMTPTEYRMYVSSGTELATVPPPRKK